MPNGQGKLTSMDINERALFYRAQSGDRRAAETLYERYYLDVFRYLYYRVNDQAAAEQLSTDVFVRMIRKLPAVQDTKINFIHWLYQIARDLVAEQEPAYQAELFSDQIMGEGDDQTTNSANRKFMLAIQKLNDHEKSIIVHRFVEGKSVKDLMKINNQSERAIQSLQHRALNALQKALEPEKYYDKTQI